MSPQRNTTPQPGMAKVIDARGPAIVRAWKMLLAAHPDLKRLEETIKRGETIIQQGDEYACAIMILEGSVREEMTVEDGNTSKTACLRKVGAGRITFVEAILETSSASARYSIITETPATIVRIDRAWLREMRLLPAKGGLEFSLVDDLVRGRSEEIDVIELALVDLLMKEKEASGNLEALLATQERSAEELEEVRGELTISNGVYEDMRQKYGRIRKELESTQDELMKARTEIEANRGHLHDAAIAFRLFEEERDRLSKIVIGTKPEEEIVIGDDEIEFLSDRVDTIFPTEKPADSSSESETPEIEVRFSIVPTEQASSASSGEHKRSRRDTLPGMPAFVPPTATSATEGGRSVARNQTMNWGPGEINQPMQLDPNGKPTRIRVSLREEEKKK